MPYSTGGIKLPILQPAHFSTLAILEDKIAWDAGIKFYFENKVWLTDAIWQDSQGNLASILKRKIRGENSMHYLIGALLILCVILVILWFKKKPQNPDVSAPILRTAAVRR